MKTKNIFVFFPLFLCLLRASVTYADAAIADFVPEKQDESSLNAGSILPLIKSGVEPAVGDDTEIDNAQLEFLARTLITEKQRLEELELEHKKLFDEIMAQPLSESGVRNQEPGAGTWDLGLRTQDSLTQVPEIDFKGLKPEGNVDLLGTADSLYKLAQYEAALQIYQSIDPEKTSEEDNSWILYQTANCYKNLNQFDNALNTCQKLQTKYPNTYSAKEAHWFLEDLRWWKQWYEKARATLNVQEAMRTEQ